MEQFAGAVLDGATVTLNANCRLHFETLLFLFGTGEARVAAISVKPVSGRVSTAMPSIE